MISAQEINTNHTLQSNIVELMWWASDAIMSIYRSEQFDTEIKADNSPVTKADLAAHHVLIEGIARLTPSVPVVSEECSKSLDTAQTSNVFWLIDPLDGTKEFINRNGEFTCNLALIENNRATYGFVAVPAQKTQFFGGAGCGSRRIDFGGEAKSIQCQPDTSRFRVVASKSHLNGETRDFIDSLEREVVLVQAGSSLKFLKLAEGKADLYPRLAPTCEWDTAAAQAVLEGAGGSVTQVDGSPLKYGKSEILNPHFIARAC